MSGKISVNTHDFGVKTKSKNIRVMCANCGFVTMADESMITEGTAVCYNCKSLALDKVDPGFTKFKSKDNVI